MTRLASQKASLPVLKEHRTRDAQEDLHSFFFYSARTVRKQFENSSRREWYVFLPQLHRMMC